MGFFTRLFGHRVEDGRITLIKELMKDRLTEYHPAIIDKTPNMMVLGTPEGTLVAIVETYSVLKQKGYDHVAIIQGIEQHRSQFKKGTECYHPP